MPGVTLTGLNFWYWFGSLLALIYGVNHLFRPDSIAKSWGLNSWQVEETRDFARLLGVWILFQSIIAFVVAKYVDNLQARYFITLAHVFKNFGAFLLRCRMWQSGRYDPITTGFMISTFADLIFTFGYGYYIVFPEKERSKEKK